MSKRPAAPTKSAAPTAVPKKPRVDWDAVERDYRTGRFTQRELADKYGVTHGAIGKQARTKGWTKDLTDEIRKATNARLVSDLVSSEVAKSSQAVATTVLAAAEVNTRIIQSHRTRLAALHDSVETAKLKLEALGETVSDIREAAVYVQAVGNLAAATKTLIEQERKAHNIDDEPADPPGAKQKRVLVEFVDVVPK